MKKFEILKATLVCAGLLFLSAAGAQTMSKADYKAGKTRISADYKADKSACSAQAGNAKDICVQEAKAKEKVARAELEYAYTGKSSDHNKVLVTKAKAAYSVARERCDDLSGNARDVCIKEAQAVETKALADIRLGKEIGDAQKDAAAQKRDADYKVEIEKCDALAGHAKTSCVTAAKAKFAKH
ncbi:MAG: hypothetical protein ACOYB1_03440 [Limnohabitans sp.]